jgi:hypothetical protein
MATRGNKLPRRTFLKSTRIMGLHPDTPLSGRVLRELRAPGLE